MSICRFSSDNFMSDVYCYESVYECWTIHVASNRLKFPPIPELPLDWLPVGDDLPMIQRAWAWVWVRLWVLSHRLHSWSVGCWPREDIDHEWAGETFNEDTADACYIRLVQLSEAGFRVPAYAIETMRVIAQEEQA